MKSFLASLVFPHSGNNHRAKALHSKSLLIIIFFFVLSSLFFSSGLNPLASGIRAFADISMTELLNATNQKRQENGLPALAHNQSLANAASRKVDDMFAKNYWAHNSPDGTTPWVFIKQSGYNYVYAGENLARGFNSANDVVNAWMASPSHRANILSPNFKDVGFAVKGGVLHGEQTFIVAQEFGSRSYVPVAKRNSPPKAVKTRRVLGFDASSVAVPAFSKSSNVALTIIFALIVVLSIDFIVTERNKIVRFVGHNFDHAVFLFAIMAIILMLNKGAVI